MLLIYCQDIPGKYIIGIKDIYKDIDLLPVPRSSDVYTSISSHPDIFLFFSKINRLIFSSSLPNDFIRKLKDTGLITIKSHNTPTGQYPNTAILNACRIGNYVLHNSNLTDSAIQREASLNNMKLIHVNQGYTRCSVVPVSGRAVITSDILISKQARKLGISVLDISKGHILLPGQEYGFIGGTMGKTPDNTIVFLGDIKLHPDGSRIENFLRTHNAKYICLPDLPLFDAGTLIFV